MFMAGVCALREPMPSRYGGPLISPLRGSGAGVRSFSNLLSSSLVGRLMVRELRSLPLAGPCIASDLFVNKARTANLSSSLRMPPAGGPSLSGDRGTLTPMNARRFARFGPFRVDLVTGELTKHDRTLRLQNQSFQILALLLERSGDLV